MAEKKACHYFECPLKFVSSIFTQHGLMTKSVPANHIKCYTTNNSTLVAN